LTKYTYIILYLKANIAEDLVYTFLSVTNLRSLSRNRDLVYWLRAVPRPEILSGFMSKALSCITGYYTWKYSLLLVKEYQYIRILLELSTKLLSNR
jgi:hypothetical protein